MDRVFQSELSSLQQQQPGHLDHSTSRSPSDGRCPAPKEDPNASATVNRNRGPFVDRSNHSVTSHAVHCQDEQARSRGCNEGSGRGATGFMESDRSSAEAARDRGGEGHHSQPRQTNDKSPGMDGQAQQGLQEKGSPEGLLHRRASNQCEEQRHHCPDAESGAGKDLCHQLSLRDGSNGIRTALQQNLWGGDDPSHRVHPVVHSDHEGGPVQQPLGALCHMGRNGDEETPTPPAGQAGPEAKATTSLVSSQLSQHRDSDDAAADPGNDDEDGGNHHRTQGGSGRSPRGTSPQEDLGWELLGGRRCEPLSESEPGV